MRAKTLCLYCKCDHCFQKHKLITKIALFLFEAWIVVFSIDQLRKKLKLIIAKMKKKNKEFSKYCCACVYQHMCQVLI